MSKLKLFLLSVLGVLLFALSYLYFCQQAQPRNQASSRLKSALNLKLPTPTPTPVLKTQLTFVGDVGLGRMVNVRIQQKGADYPFLKTAPILKSADLTFANLESPLVENCPLKYEGMIFCGPPENVQALKHAGVDLVSVANNHIYNYGQEGFKQTINTLKSHQIEPIGNGHRLTKDINGVKFGFLAYNSVGETINQQQIKTDLKDLNSQVDVLVVSFHWGVEYVSQPNSFQKETAHFLVDHGADLVIGHHPHWVQTDEVYQGKRIFYSLGNFVFDQMWSQKTREGMILTTVFKGSELVEVKRQPVLINDHCQPEIITNH